MDEVITTTVESTDSGVNEPAAAGQEQEVDTTEQTQELAESGAKEQAAAVPSEDRAFAARLAKARKQDRDELIAEIYGHAGISTYDDYLAAKAAHEAEEAARKERERVEELTQRGIPEEDAQVVLEAKEIKRQQKDYADFLHEYADVDPKSIPLSVWKETEKGVPLVQAYRNHEYKQLKAELAELKKGAATQKSNAANSTFSPSSPNGNGGDNSSYYTLDQLKSMSREEVNKNYSKVVESYRKLTSRP